VATGAGVAGAPRAGGAPGERAGARAEDSPAGRPRDALACLPELLREARRDAAVCVTHTHTLNQMSEDGRAALTAVLSESSRDLPLYRLSAEWLTGIHPLVELTSWAGANVTTRRLAFSDPHGRWIEWLGDRTAARPFE